MYIPAQQKTYSAKGPGLAIEDISTVDRCWYGRVSQGQLDEGDAAKLVMLGLDEPVSNGKCKSLSVVAGHDSIDPLNLARARLFHHGPQILAAKTVVTMLREDPYDDRDPSVLRRPNSRVADQNSIYVGDREVVSHGSFDDLLRSELDWPNDAVVHGTPLLKQLTGRGDDRQSHIETLAISKKQTFNEVFYVVFSSDARRADSFEDMCKVAPVADAPDGNVTHPTRHGRASVTFDGYRHELYESP
jgi:hypothetical protein